jgi:peptidoglycan/LPS O-acetylase OafA/YrhL
VGFGPSTILGLVNKETSLVQSEAATTAPRGHLNHLDGMRALAAIYVVLHHAFLQSWPTIDVAAMRSNPKNWPLFTLAFGHSAVTAFIAISGFSLALPIVRGNGFLKRGFFKRRALRILPPYYAAVLLAVLLTLAMHHADLTEYHSSLPVTPSNIASHLLLIHTLFPSHFSKIAGPFWSIAIESQIYLCFPLLVWLRRTRGMKLTLLVCLLLSLLCLGISHETRAGLPALYFLVFGLGMYAADLVFNGKRLPYGWITLIFGVLSAALLAAFPSPSGVAIKVTDVTIGIAAAAMMASGVASPRGLINRVLSLPFLVAVGGFSYSIYLIHFPIQQIFWEQVVFPRGISKGLGFSIVAILGTLCIIACSYLFSLLFEKPMMRKRAPVPALALERVV